MAVPAGPTFTSRLRCSFSKISFRVTVSAAEERFKTLTSPRLKADKIRALLLSLFEPVNLMVTSSLNINFLMLMEADISLILL